MDIDFEGLTPEEQREVMRELYERRDQGVGSNVRFMDDLGKMFVEEDCGGDMNFTIFGGFSSLNPPEVWRLFKVLEERVRDYPVSVKGPEKPKIELHITEGPPRTVYVPYEHPRRPW